jgi:3-oxoacyl-[acyl-carrier-protein] synthase III
MRFDNVSILSVAHIDAPHRIPSEDLEARLAPVLERLGMRPDLLRDLSGIVARRFWDEGVMPSDMATKAAEIALESVGLERSKLGVLINTSVCRDYVEPSTACIVHGNLELPSTCMNFDLGNACLAFVNGMDMVGNMIERGQIDYGIVVDAESSRFVTEKTLELLTRPDIDELTFRGSFATLTLGSGAAAMVLCRSDLAPDGHRFLGGVNRAATQHCRLCYGQVDHMVTDTRQLLVAGLETRGPDLATGGGRTRLDTRRSGLVRAPPGEQTPHREGGRDARPAAGPDLPALSRVREHRSRRRAHRAVQAPGGESVAGRAAGGSHGHRFRPELHHGRDPVVRSATMRKGAVRR